MQILLQDIRYALRIFRKNPGFTILAILTLAVGIGANTAIFTVTNGLFFRPLPVTDPSRLVRISSMKPAWDLDVSSYPNYLALRERAKSFSDIAAHAHSAVSLNVGNVSDSVKVEVVSGNYFRVYQFAPAIGRMLTPEDDRKEGAHPLVVISYRLWKKYFQNSPRVIGTKIFVNGHPFEIIGVTPETFSGTYLTSDADLWGTIAMHEELRPRGIPITNTGWGWLEMTARLKPNVGLSEASAELSGISAELQKEYPRENDGLKFQLIKAKWLPEDLNRQMEKALQFLSAVAILILLVVCANIAGALLPRMVQRKRELAIRNSLGASPSRLMRQWLTEAMTLCMLGGIGGILTAFWCRESIQRFFPSEWQAVLANLPLDIKVLSFAWIISIATGFLCGTAAAAQLRKEQIQPALKGETGGVPRHRLFGIFVSAQTAISILLLIVAGLLLQSLAGSSSFRVGFDKQDLLLATIDTRRHNFTNEKALLFFEQLTENLRHVPGVVSASYATVTPLANDQEAQAFKIPGQDKVQIIADNSVGPHYFQTLRIPLVSGRDFVEQDLRSNSVPVAVVNETMAKKFWPNENPIGKNIQLQDGPQLQIIGIAKDIQYYSIGEKPMSYIYTTPNVIYTGQMTLQIRAQTDPEALISSLHQQIRRIDSNVAAYEVMSFESLRKAQLFPIRALTTISVLFGILGLILTSLGIYGIIAYAVAQRTKEIGLRMALGSSRSTVLWMVLGQGMKFVIAGSAIGIMAALLTTRFLQSVLFQTSPTDFVSYAGTLLLILCCALIAASLPTRRAMNIDPAIALRYE